MNQEWSPSADLRANWEQIKTVFDAGVKSGLHCALATVGPDGYPHVTPIGFIFLRADYRAFYFEEYTKKAPENIGQNPRVCLLAVNSGRWFWARSLYEGRFSALPGIRLVGVAGELRRASEQEKSAYRARAKAVRRLRGYDLLWRDLNHVRDIQLERFEPVRYPRMTDHLWR